MKTILKLLAVLALVVAIVGCPQPQTPKETNSWVIEPSIINWVFGDTPSDPTGEALFGDVVFSYEKENGTTLDATPTEIGTYTLVASVAGTNNYTGLSKEVDFAILAPSEGLIYVENPDGTTASVTDIGTFTGTDLVIASTYNNKPVAIIGEEAFSSKDTITSVVIPNSVTTIEDAAFSECNILESVVIGDSVTTIGIEAFSFCIALESVVIPDSVETIGGAAFAVCSGLESAEIPDSVETIGDSAFAGCSGLENVVIGDSVESIGIGVFALCTKLAAIECNENNSSYKSVNGVLYNEGITELITYPIGKTDKSFSIPNTVEIIRNAAFFGCVLLESVEIPDSVKTVGEDAFAFCSALKSVEIPNSVETIKDGAFEGCSALESVVIGEGLATINYYLFLDCSSLTSITIPSSVTMIESTAFGGCDALTVYAITLPASGWNTLWNSSARPVVWGCTLSDGESEAPYVVSVTKTDTTLENADATKTLNAPYRTGYTFAGWTKTENKTTADEGLKTADTLRTAVNNGETVYAVWTKN